MQIGCLRVRGWKKVGNHWSVHVMAFNSPVFSMPSHGVFMIGPHVLLPLSKSMSFLLVYTNKYKYVCGCMLDILCYSSSPDIYDKK